LTGSPIATPAQIDKVERGHSDRPGGRRFGALVHAVLASVDFNAEADAIRESAATNGKLVGSTEEEVDASGSQFALLLLIHSYDRRPTAPKKKAGQGSVISPLLANVYLHYVFDLWAEHWRQREATGEIVILRYADDSAPRRREEEVLM